MKSWKKLVLAGIMLALIGTITETFAEDNDNPPGYGNIGSCIARKLGRGVSNVAFGALEIPLQVYEVNFEEGGIAACTYGVFKGIGYFVARELVGVVEIATFPVPLPGCPNDPMDQGAGYGPIMTPEWIITPETNYYNFVFQKNHTM